MIGGERNRVTQLAIPKAAIQEVALDKGNAAQSHYAFVIVGWVICRRPARLERIVAQKAGLGMLGDGISQGIPKHIVMVLPECVASAIELYLILCCQDFIRFRGRACVACVVHDPSP